MVRTLWRSRVVRLLVGVAAGGSIGVGLFYARQLEGASLFVLTGAVAGGIGALLEHSYRRSAQLAEVKVTVPQLSELRFVVTKDTKKVAWKLFVETVTRVSTQRLDNQDGLLREALGSLYSLFEVVRTTLKDSLPSNARGSAPTVEQLAITMLNRELRPFLSRWHPALHRWELANPDADESAWPDNAECRQELRVVQQHLREYALGYAKLAGVSDAATIISGSDLGLWASAASPPRPRSPTAAGSTDAASQP